MNLVANAQKLLIRFRYPVSLPEDVGYALGLPISNEEKFTDMLHFLLSASCKPTKLSRFMPRAQVERAFDKALQKERFGNNSLFSFYFTQGWLEFDLQFDQSELLRRIYIHHKLISHPHGYELPLPSTPAEIVSFI